LQQLPITVTLKSGNTEINYPSDTTDASGNVTLTLASLPSGAYTVRAKGPKYLAISGTIQLDQATLKTEHVKRPGLRPSAAFLDMGLLRAGDANNDNTVSSPDFNILRNSLGKAFGEPSYDDRADFTGDRIVNVVDFNLLRNNFGSGGPPSIRPTAP
jgi:hypothetical protein